MALPAALPEPGSGSTASFGYWVRRRRLALDLTQADLARAVSCATITIAKIERDERRPSRQMAALLADHLAVPADERTRFLAAALGEVAADRLVLDNRPLATVAAAPSPLHSNLSTPATPFVGRRAELDRLSAALADPACRLLTLLGPGGFGKTRLAIRLGELALAQGEHFPDGVFFVALDGLAGRELVIPAAAAALDFTFYAQEDQMQQLLRYLAPKRLLLILDNAEGILDPDLVLRLLAAAPGIKILVTTRAALNLQQEWLHPIAGMDTGTDTGTIGDDAGAVGQPQMTAARAAALADAVVLFHHSALRVRPAFDLSHELVHVQQICRLVEGAPLAIELAAAWLKALPCAEVARELARGIDLLTTSMHDVPTRHRSMRAALEQSWRHLAEEEQVIFRGLSLFEGGFRLEAAQAVIGAPLRGAGGARREGDAPTGAGRPLPDPRPPARARRRTPGRPAPRAGGMPRSARRYYLFFLAARSAILEGSGQGAALHEIQEEMDNVRAAWAYAAANGPLSALRDALPALSRFLWMRGRYAEGEQMARLALEYLDAGTPAEEPADEKQALRIALLANAAHFGGAVGAYDRALPAAHSALDAALRRSSAAAAHCHYVLGIVQAYALDQAAIANLRTAHAAYRALDNEAGTAEAALQLGFYLWAWHGDLVRAQSLVDESLARYRALGDAFGLADALNNSALLRWYGGDVEGAERLYRESLQTANTNDNRLVALQATGGLAFVALARGQCDAAIDLGHRRLALAQQLGHENQVNHSLTLLVLCYLCAERFIAAAELLNRLPEVWRLLIYAPQVYVGIGDYETAFGFLARATATLTDDVGDEIIAATLLLGWATLLVSGCRLQAVHDPTPAHLLAPGERHALAVELLVAVHSHAPTDPATRARAARLLARQYAQAGELPPDPPPARSVRELAGEMLALRLA